MKWTKIIILCCITFIISCKKVEPIPKPTTQKIFSVSESSISDGQLIYFDLPITGTYTLTLIDKNTGQVMGRERFNGQIGENVKKIYTKSLPIKNLYLILEDITKKEIGKTTIIIIN